jgi:ubiquinone/menaquinone biosynthesis C-methylase UbiE
VTTDSVGDFGRQWTRYTHALGRTESEAYLADIVGPLLSLDAIDGRRVADLGAGNGRFTEVLAGRAARVLSVEPSDAMTNNRTRNARFGNVDFLHARIEELPPDASLDLAFCIGVLHHVADMRAALVAVRRALVPGGRLVLWVYGREGNGLYLGLVRPMRAVTIRVPDGVLHAVASALVPVVKGYRALCRRVPAAPLASYFNNVLSWCDDATLRLGIFDQLNPRIARYLSRAELIALLHDAGFPEPALYHRHGYSWTAVAEAA